MSCQQVLGLNLCNMIALKYEFLDTSFKRLDLILWVDSGDEEGMNGPLDKNI